MIELAASVFWISMGLLVWSYLLYPPIINILAKVFGNKPEFDPSYLPSVAVLIPAYNEEDVIAKKVQNILDLEWPPDRISVWVGSDQSSDATEEIVKRLALSDSRITLWRAPDRGGKTQVINRLLPTINAELILLTDANTMHKRDCLKRMAGYFAGDEVGAVAGRIEHESRLEDAENAENTYRSFEVWQKYNEALLHSSISAFGGFYLLRKSLFRPIPLNAYSNDDVLIPMDVIRQRKRVFFEPNAISTEDITGDFSTEFKRRVRIGAGNFQSFSWLIDFLNPFLGWPCFCYISHKVLRWFSPILLLLAFISLGFLAAFSGLQIYTAAFAIACAGSILTFVGWNILRISFLRSTWYFLAMNMALLLGLFRFLGGIKSAAWGRTQRS